MPPLPDGDVLVHAGDCTGSGTLAQLENFADWYGRQPHKKKVLIAGNHDYCFERDAEQSRQICESRGITYLVGETAIINGIWFYGFPWQPVFRSMAFNADEPTRRDLLAAIPDDIEVLVTHSPAYLIFDWVPFTGEHADWRIPFWLNWWKTGSREPIHNPTGSSRCSTHRLGSFLQAWQIRLHQRLQIHPCRIGADIDRAEQLTAAGEHRHRHRPQP